MPITAATTTIIINTRPGLRILVLEITITTILLQGRTTIPITIRPDRKPKAHQREATTTIVLQQEAAAIAEVILHQDLQAEIMVADLAAAEEVAAAVAEDDNFY